LVGISVRVDYDIAVVSAMPAAADEDEGQILAMNAFRQRRPDCAGRQNDGMFRMLAAASGRDWVSRSRRDGMLGQWTPRVVGGERRPDARRRLRQTDVRCAGNLNPIVRVSLALAGWQALIGVAFLSDA
jgi:hypothetical protein